MDRNGSIVTLAMALVAGAIGFGTITWMRRPAKPSELDALLAAYMSPANFKSFVYHRPSDREWYTMLDVFSEGNDQVRWINLQIILPGRGHELLRTYAHQRANCRSWQATTIGEGDTLDQMIDAKPNGHFYELVEGSVQTRSAVTACRYAGKI